MTPELRQRLLELHYDLLPEGEAAELRRRVESEPELAAALAEVEKTAAIFAQAARLPIPKVAFKRPEATPMSTTPESTVAPKLSKSPAARRAFGRRTNWLVAAAALILVIITAGGYFYNRHEMATLAAEHVRVIVSGPSMLQQGIESTFAVSTSEITGNPLSAPVEMSLYSVDGKRLYSNEKSTNSQGRFQFSIPADISLPPAATVKFVVWNPTNREEKEEFSTPVSIEPLHYATQLSLDKPLYQPRETVLYRSLTLSRFGMAADHEIPLAYEIQDPSGAVVANSHAEGLTDRGVGNGSFPIPAELAGGQYTLVAKSLDGSVPEEKRKFFIRRYRLPRLKKDLEFARDSYTPGDTVIADFSAHRAEGGPAANAKLRILATVDEQNVFEKSVQANEAGAYRIEFKLPEKIERGDGQLAAIIDDGGTNETMAKTIPINLGKVEVKFYPEGGDLVAGLENRVYFTAKNPVGKPVHIQGLVMNDRGDAVADAETTYEGMGAFTFTPRSGGSYHLKINKPTGVKEDAKLPSPMTDRFVILNTGSGVFGPNEPLEFVVRSAKPDVPLVVSAWCRGVLVGQQPLVTQKNENGMNPVSIAIPEGIGGVIRLTVFDYSPNADAAQPPVPQPIAERLVYRRLDKKLTVRAAEHQEKYSPGEKVKASLVVTNEKGEPTPATLGVSVVDDALLNLADDKSPNLTTHFLLSTEIDKPEDLEKADFYLSEETKNGVKAGTALDLLLGTQGWRRFAEKTLPELAAEGPEKDQLTRLVAMNGEAAPPTLFDNLSQISKTYAKSLDAYKSERTRIINMAMVICFLVGLGLLLMVVMLGLLKMVRGFGFWLPALGATACCVLVASMTLDPSRFNLGRSKTVAFLSYQTKVAPTTTGAEIDELADADGEEIKKLGEGKAIRYGGALRGRAKVQEYMLKQNGEAAEDKLVKAMPMKPPIGTPAAAVPQKAAADAEVERKAEMANVPAAPALVPGFGMPGGGLGGIGGAGQPGMAGGRGMQMGNRLDAAAKGQFGRASRWHYAPHDTPEQLVLLQQYRFPVREYAHEHVAGKPGVRSDFAETLYWNPLLIAGADGKTPIAFDLSDSVTTFRLRADAHGAGRIGSGRADIISRIPFNLEPKLPLEVNAGDRIDLPLAVVNDSPNDLNVVLKLEHGDLVKLGGDAERELDLPAGKRGRESFTLDVTGEKGECDLTVRGAAGNLSDAVTRKLKIVPPGFPKNASYAGRIDGPQEVTVHLPEAWVPGSLEVTLNAFPTTLATIQKGLDGILQEPNGCFEQASTSNYPNVMTMQYMEDNNVANPAVTRRSKELLQKGYGKLTGYECKQKGYEWFGGDPGHEALTAYGLMQFRDMKQVYPVDDAMLKRTAEWLLARRDGKGGYQRNAKALDSFGAAPAEVTDAYITWALCESGEKNIDPEVAHSVEAAEKSEDAYVIALAASAAIDAGKTDDGKKLLDKLAKLQAEDGHLEGKLGSITRSGGVSLAVETTALAALAWLKEPAFTAQANKAIEWVVKNRQGRGGFGSTQATILALKALVNHAKANKHPLSAGKLILMSKDVPMGEKEFTAGQQETISVGGLEAKLKPGDNSLNISLTGESKLPYALDVTYRTLKPASDEKCPIRLKTSLAKPEVKAGETVALLAEVSNATEAGQPMTIAILGLPAGLEPRADQLEELKKAGTIDYYETRAREVIFYWRSLAPKKQIALKLDLIAAVPGKYTAPASRVYLYYTPEQKQWADPLAVEISR
jgi:uncharacterized protein YfaS (alpha-2-macroglobulin family)/uncharacterized membrane protein